MTPVGRKSTKALKLESLSNSEDSKQNGARSPSISDRDKIETTAKRYLILFLFCLSSANKAFQWIQIPAGTKKITYYYGVDNYVINALGAIFLMSFVFMSWLACFMIERLGIRRSVILASTGAAIGSIIKCFSCTEDGIILLAISQVMVSVSEQFIFSVPVRLASVWFPDNQVSTALGVTVLGNQLGVAIGFVIPQLLLNNAETRDEIGLALYYMFLGTAIFSTLLLIADYFFFDEAPRFAPGAARLKQIEEELRVREEARSITQDIALLWTQIKKLLHHRQFVILSLSYGINIGIMNVVATILNQMMEPLWPGDDILIGNTGFCIIIFGALGSFFWGRILDKNHKYLFLNVFLTIATMVSLAFFTYALGYTRSQFAIYAAASLFGLFQVGVMVAGMELAVELTYPAPELVTASIMNWTPQTIGTVFIFIASFIVDNYGQLATNGFYMGCLLVALLMLLCLKEKLNRQNAVNEKNESHV